MEIEINFLNFNFQIYKYESVSIGKLEYRR